MPTSRASRTAPLPFTIPGVSEKDSRTVIRILQERLTALSDLHLTLKHAHWNVVGPHFIGVHLMLDPQVDAVRLMADALAERIAAMGGSPTGTPGAIVAARTWDDYSLGRADALQHLAALDVVYQGVVTSHRDAIEATEEPDPVSQDMLIGQAHELEQFHWFIRAHLEGTDGHLATAGAKTLSTAARRAAPGSSLQACWVDEESGRRAAADMEVAVFSKKQTLADQLVEVLVQAGVTNIFGLVGDSLNSFSDAVRRSGGSAKGGIDWVHVHNEESAAFAASAQAQLTGRLAVCAASCGPGNTHLIQGVFDAQRSGAPVLVLASHIFAVEIGTGFFQETDPKQLFAQASQWCEMVSTPDQMPRLARIAIQHAVGLGGAAVLVLPGDVLGSEATHETGTSAPAARRSPSTPPDDVLDDLASRLNAAGTVTIFGGIGCAGARDEVLQLAEILKAPVGHSIRGKESLQYDNPYDVGMSGLLGYGGCFDACNEADVLLLLGTDFPYVDFLPQKNTIQVDIDPSRLGRRTPLELGVAGDVKATIDALLPRLAPKQDRAFLDRMLGETVKKMEHVVDGYTHDVENLTPIHPEYVAHLLDEECAVDAVFTADTGMCCSWLARYIIPNGRRRLLGSWVHGTMANALPMALGAQFAYPSRQVVSMSGDGGLAMLLGELLTAMTHNLPVKVIVFNNSSLGMVRLEMLVAGDPPFETDHDMVDFAAIARAVGFHAVRVEEPGDVRAGLREVLQHDGPALLDVVTDANALEVPSHVTAEEAKGFALSVGKVVLGGGVGNMLELARTNLRNIPRP